ncbi:MAG: cellulose binding domain-containing protein [Ruminococcus sp.]
MKLNKKMSRFTAGSLGIVMGISVMSSFPVFADETDPAIFDYDGYSVSCSVTNSWNNTEIISVTLTNTSDITIENWMLYFDPNGQVDSVWDAQQVYTSSGTAYFKNSGYNASVAPNASVAFSYTVENCESIPDSFTLCQTRTEKESGYEVTLQVNQSWGDSFNGEIILQNNTNAPIEAWELTIDTNFTITEITNSWSADVTELEPYSYLLKGTYTGTVAANSSVSLGFIGVKNGVPAITSCSLTEVVVDEDAILWGRLLDGNISSDSLNDADNDGLPDLYEEKLGTDENNADSDSDGLPDGYEVLTLGSDPLSSYSFDSNISDGNYDSDQDGLCNYQEYVSETDPNCSDSDYDGLSDGNEINTYGTNPLNPDTDGDGLSDGDEVALGLNPLVVDSDEDGIPDNEEKFLQSLTYDTEDADTVIDSVEVSFEGTGYINSNTSVENIMDTDWMCSNVIGLVGAPYDISSDSSFDTATLTFTVDKSSLGNTEFDDLAILWYNEEEQRFVEMETISDVEASTLTTTVGHFSKYLIVDSSRWYAAWNANYYPTSDIDLHTAITIDCSSSMNSNDPNRCRVDAAKGFVNVMHDNDMASVTLFASHVSTQSLGTLTQDKNLLKETIDNVTSLGVTNYEEALQYSINSLDVNNNSSSENIIIFLSDGYPTNDSGYAIDPSDFDYSVVDTATAAGIKIYTIGLTDNVCETVLKEMADRTGGEYFYANTAEELVPYFLNINVTEKYDTTTDTDGDGIPDLFETYGMPAANGYVLFSDPQTKDTDGDGLEDGEEVSVIYVNDDADAKLAAEYILEYYPDIEVNACGGIYFKMISDPEDTDTDDDQDLDNADPNPMAYQLNGYFAQKIGELQKAAQEYLEDSYTPSASDYYYGKKDIWLTFSFLRCYNSHYNWTHSSWNSAAGKLSESEFGAFKNFLNSNSSYEDLYDYFVNTNVINAGNIGEQIDLYHMCATLSAYSYTDFAKIFVGEDYINNLCGWSGDFQTLMNSAYDKTYNKNQYTDIYSAFYNQMGKSNDYFSNDDLYADIVSLGINEMFSKDRNLPLEEVFNSFFSYSNTEDYVKDFGNTISLDDINEFTEKYTFDFFITKKIDQYNANYNISDEDIQNGIDAFVKYLYDNYGCEIK